MTEAQFDTILAKQTPDSQKRALANFVIETVDLEETRVAVQSCLDQIRESLSNA